MFAVSVCTSTFLERKRKNERVCGLWCMCLWCVKDVLMNREKRDTDIEREVKCVRQIESAIYGSDVWETPLWRHMQLFQS